MKDLINDVKQLIIETLELEDIEPADIADEEPLFIDGLGLDSIDALELGVAIKKAYNVKIDGDSEDSKKHFYSVNSLCQFIKENR